IRPDKRHVGLTNKTTTSRIKTVKNPKAKAHPEH
uniref:Uncharacterized protein n=1 Tax=Aegilops tauschii subsp. strangulata TaxID=200361 RepID=A0A453L5K8_AEGTS